MLLPPTKVEALMDRYATLEQLLPDAEPDEVEMILREMQALREKIDRLLLRA